MFTGIASTKGVALGNPKEIYSLKTRALCPENQNLSPSPRWHTDSTFSKQEIEKTHYSQIPQYTDMMVDGGWWMVDGET